MQRVGIVGGYGKVGTVVSRFLAEESGLELRIGGRNSEAAKAAACELEAEHPACRCVGCEVNVFDAESLVDFCSDCDIVVNCTGPTALVGDRVARTAVAVGAHFVDPGGYEYVLSLLDDLRSEMDDKGLVFCFAAGIVPGLSGSLPMAVARSFSRVRSLRSYFAGEDTWSYGSAYDMTCGMQELRQQGPCRMQRGRVERLPFHERYLHLARLPKPMGRRFAQPFFTQEFNRVASSIGCDDARCFWANTGPAFSLTLGVVRLFRLYGSPEQIDRSARWLCRAASRDARRSSGSGYLLSVIVGGECDGAERTRTGWLHFPDSYTGTGLAAAMMTRKLVREPPVKAEAGFFPDMMDPDEAVSVLGEAGIFMQTVEGVI